MSYRKVALRLAFVAALFVIASPAVFTQDQSDPTNKPRNVKPELKLISDLLPIDLPSGPAVANTHVACRLSS